MTAVSNFLQNVFLVVWKPGDSAVVEWPVVERGLCIICGVPWSRLCSANLERGESHAWTFRDRAPLHAQRSQTSSFRRTLSVLTHISAWLQKDQFILYEVHNVFAVDALASSHPLSCREDEVNSPAQISEMFSTISYSKVCSSFTT